MGDVVHHPLDPDDTLRAAKTAIRGIRHGVGFQTMREYPYVRQVVCIIRMQHGAVGHGQGQVHRPAAFGELFKDHRLQATVIVKSRFVINAEVMPFARDDHIIIAVIAHLGRTVQTHRNHGTSDCQRIALTFLAPKTTAHTAGFNAHGVHGNAQGLGHFMLDFSRVLRRGMDQHVALVRLGRCGLTFKIEMLLPADFHAAFDLIVRRGHRAVSIAVLEGHRVFKLAVCRHGIIDG